MPITAKFFEFFELGTDLEGKVTRSYGEGPIHGGVPDLLISANRLSITDMLFFVARMAWAYEN